MQQLLSREAREAEVYKRELIAWFKEQKKEQEQSTMLEEHTAKEKFKVRQNNNNATLSTQRDFESCPSLIEGAK